MARAEDAQTDENDLFSLDMSNHNGKAFSRRASESVPELFLNEGITELVAQISHHTSFEEKLLGAVRRSKMRCAVNNTSNCTILARLLQEEGYFVRLHGPGTENSHGKKGNNCLETLHHNYLTCTGDSKTCLQEELIVEPRFKEEFEIAHPTERYKAYLRVLPAEYVGTAGKLAFIVEKISQAAADAFEEQGMTVPPWRRTTATLSKWALEPSKSEQLLAESAKKQRGLSATDLTKVGFHVPSAPMPAPPVAAPPRSRRTPDCPATLGRPKRVSQLAQDLADMKKSPVKRRSEPKPNNSAQNSNYWDWDFCGGEVPRINTVRRTGRVQ